MVCVGIDVAKDKHDCCILDSEGTTLVDCFSVLHLDRGVPLPDTKSPMANTSAVWSWDLMLFRPSGVNSNQS